MKLYLILSLGLILNINLVFSQNTVCRDTLIKQKYLIKEPMSLKNEIIFIQDNQAYQEFFGVKSKIDFSKNILIAFFIKEVGDVYNTTLEISCNSDSINVHYILKGPYGMRKRYIHYTSSIYVLRRLDLTNANFTVRYINNNEETFKYNNQSFINLDQTPSKY